MTIQASSSATIQAQSTWFSLLWTIPFAVLWGWLIFRLPALVEGGFPAMAARVMSCGLIALGLWLGLERTDLTPSLIGFCGAPWTVATYMVEGQGSADQAQARLWAYRDPAGFARLIELLIDTSIAYLCGQIDAGADVLQIFDTWAGALPDLEFARWVVAPTQRIVAGVRRRHPEVPIIGFPRGAGLRIGGYAEATGVQGIGCDAAVPLVEMAELAKKHRRVVQGNLDPLVLAAGGQACDVAASRLLEAMHGRPFICNLGHGIRPETPPEHVARLVALVRAYR